MTLMILRVFLLWLVVVGLSSGIFKERDIVHILRNVNFDELTDCYSISGYGNNLKNPHQGSAGTDLKRNLPPYYLNGVDAMPRMDVNPRHVSNVVVAENVVLLNSKGSSDWLWAFGQFIDHDLVRTRPGKEEANIQLPNGDSLSSLMDHIGFTRTIESQKVPVYAREYRNQKNLVTSYLDLSTIYGSTYEMAEHLREKSFFQDRGKLYGTDFLPKNKIFKRDYLFNDAPGLPTDFFLSGDSRTNEVITLTAIHTLFYREHNRLAELIYDASRELNFYLTSDQIYKLARMLNIWQYQFIIYNEFLPTLIGLYTPSLQSLTYNPFEDASTTNEFATVGFRLGHTLISSNLILVGKANDVLNVRLRDAFFQPHIVEENGIDPILKGLANQRCRDIDPLIVDDLRNFLFRMNNFTVNAIDLSVLNMQRSRDHGLPGYDAFASFYQQKNINEIQFDSISFNPEKLEKLMSVYPTVSDVDPWIGLLCEEKDIQKNSQCGKTLSSLLQSTFTKLITGDRCFHTHHLHKLGTSAHKTTLKEIIIHNTGIQSSELKPNVFFV